MQAEKMSPNPYSSVIPELQVAWDSTSLRDLLLCPRKYQLRILQGWKTHKMAVDLEFGLHYHKALEIFDTERIQGNPEAMQEAVGYVMRCGFDSDVKDKNRFTLARSVAWYCDRFENDPLEPVVIEGEPAVEYSFRYALDMETPGREPYILCGHFDGIVREGPDGRVCVRERKTTRKALNEYYFETFSPDVQISMYALAGKIALPTPTRRVIVDAAQTAVNFTDFARFPVPRTDAYLDEFLTELKIWLKQAEAWAVAGFWPKNEASCRMCEFKKICSQDPSVQKGFLEAEFVSQPWNPLKVR